MPDHHIRPALFVYLLCGGVVHEGHVVCDELFRVVRLYDGRKYADGERDGGGFGGVVEGLPDADLRTIIQPNGVFAPQRFYDANYRVASE